MSVIQKKTPRALAQQKHASIDSKIKRVQKQLLMNESDAHSSDSHSRQEEQNLPELNAANLKIKDEES